MDSRPRLLLRSIFGDHRRVSLCLPRPITVGGASMARVVKRSVVVSGQKTSLSLERGFWSELKEIAGREGLSVAQLVTRIDSTRGDDRLASAIRMFVLREARARAIEGLMNPERPGRKTGCDPAQ
jgi:predicted DNA-binding ribbon-helix-helix protein